MVSHGSADRREAEPEAVVTEESPAERKLSLPLGCAAPRQSGGTHYRGLERPADPCGRAVIRGPRAAADRGDGRVRSGARAGAKRRRTGGRGGGRPAARPERCPSGARSRPTGPRVGPRPRVRDIGVHDNGRREARPAPRRSSAARATTTGGSSDPDGGESEPGPPAPGSTPSLAFTGPRVALARAVARWEAGGGRGRSARPRSGCGGSVPPTPGGLSGSGGWASPTSAAAPGARLGSRERPGGPCNGCARIPCLRGLRGRHRPSARRPRASVAPRVAL